jgi:glycosyltransferase involved in cell wall biosynthesis
VKVLMVVGRATGGIGHHVDDLVRGLRDEGHEVTVVTATETADALGWDDAHRLWPVHAGLRAPRGLLDWHRIMLLAGEVEVVHAHGHQAAIVAAVAAGRARPHPRLVVSLHNDLPPGTRNAARRAVGWALGRADLVTGASADLVDLASQLGAGSTELAEVPSARTGHLLEAERLTPEQRGDLLAGAGLPDDVPLVLTVSRIAPQKQLETFVAAATASNGLAAWVVIGSGDPALRTALERRAVAASSDVTTVRLLGPRDDVERWLRAADVFVLTSRWEARALVVQEAMAAGLPVVVSAVGGLPALVGDAGETVPPADPAALATRVDRLLATPDERLRLGRAARSRATMWRTPRDEARRWAERYLGLLGP